MTESDMKNKCGFTVDVGLNFPFYWIPRCFPYFFTRRPLLASKNNDGSSHPC